jgi:hypothetical protein
MPKRRIFTKEKVLYFAQKELTFHVAVDEPADTDCSQIVRALEKANYLELKTSNLSGDFYTITEQGILKLLKLQIEWRKANNKSTSELQRKLRETTEITDAY